MINEINKMDNEEENKKTPLIKSETLFNVGAVLIGFLLIGSLIYGVWWAKREWNAYWFYDDATVEIVCAMVKPEYLKDGINCN